EEKADMARRVIETSNAPKPVGTYSQAVVVDNVCFTAGQIALNPISGEMIAGDFKQEVNQVIHNLQAVLSGAGLTLDDVVKFTVYVTDLSTFAVVNEVLARYYPSEPPARSVVQVAGLPKNARIEIECIAAQ
ncbi:MAG TPA: Rid family detoxifying hydrolase, partial [bacterium]|nr:Rid family detoxifying hydrolase [bacterium]